MNIIVNPFGSGLYYCRPDTTWEKENKDFYVPEGLTEILWSPIIFARISKAGKCVGKKFVSRYFDAFNFGILLYCRPESSSDTSDIAFSSCLDHTSFLPFPLYNPIVKEGEENTFIVEVDGMAVYETKSNGIEFENAICGASRYTSLRIGDIVAMELAPAAQFASQCGNKLSLRATFCGNTIIEKEIIF